MKKFIFVLIAIISISFTANAQYATTYTSRSGQEYLIKSTDVNVDTMPFYAQLINNYETTNSKIESDKGLFWGGFVGSMVTAGAMGITAYSGADEFFTMACVFNGICDIVMAIGGIKWIIDLGERGRQEIQLIGNGIVIPF